MPPSTASERTDNTNAETSTRQKWVDLARRHSVPVRCLRFTAPVALCVHNDAVRALNVALFNPEQRAPLPGVAFTSFAARLEEPRAKNEGFQDVVEVRFRFRGSEAQRRVWGMYWT